MYFCWQQANITKKNILDISEKSIRKLKRMKNSSQYKIKKIENKMKQIFNCALNF